MTKEKPSTKLCKHCKTEIPYGAKVCPQCRKKQGMSKILIIIIVFFAIGLIGSCFGGKTSETTTTIPEATITETAKETTVAPETTIAETTATSEITTAEITTVTEIAESTGTEMTIGQKNALNKGKSYLDYTAFSYSGLIKQLEYEQFSTEDATFAADNCGADWNEQAAKKAADYLDYSSFSRSGLIGQLEYEGFTTEQAEYGATAAGY